MAPLMIKFLRPLIEPPFIFATVIPIPEASIPDSDRGEFDGLWAFKTDINQTPFNAKPTFFVGLWIVNAPITQ